MAGRTGTGRAEGGGGAVPGRRPSGAGAGRRPGPPGSARAGSGGRARRVRGRVSGERRPAPRSASSRRTGGQLGGRAQASSAWGWRAREGRAARNEEASLWLVRGSHRDPGSLHVGRGEGGVGGPGEPGRARGGSAGSLRREETPGPGWRPWEAGRPAGGRAGGGGAFGREADSNEAAMEG